MKSLVYRINCAGLDQLISHLRSCDNSFQPPLSSRVDLSSYASKLVAVAQRFEAWRGNHLVGLVATYCNDQLRRTAFITSVSVLPQSQRQGIAAHLLDDCLEHVISQKFISVELEVNPENQAATALYKKYGFVHADIDQSSSTMILTL